MAATIRIHDGYVRPVHETVVDGIQTFWVESGEPFRAKLAFRVGRVDESLLTSGISHTVEHLALPPLIEHLSDLNGSTGALFTYFEGEGEKREVLDFLIEVGATLKALPVRRLNQEKRVLLEEGADFYPTIRSRLEWQRFGARHLGLYDEPEYGMHELTPQQVARWTRKFFTAGNAVLWMTGRPPRGFTLPLPAGPLRPPPRPPTPSIPLPAWTTGSVGGIGWSTLTQNVIPARFALSIVRNRLLRRLRYELGLSYAVSLAWDAIGRNLTHGVLSAGVVEGYEQAAAEEMIRSLDELSVDGPTAAELRWHKRDAIYHATPGGEVSTWLNNLAFDRLLEREPVSMSDWVAQVKALRATDIERALREMLALSILRTPAEIELPESRYAGVPIWGGDEPVRGRRFNEPASEQGDSDQLVVADDGISYIDADGAGTIRFAEAAALVRREGIPSALYRLDGQYIDFGSIENWPRGNAALRAVSATTPRRLVIDVP